MTEKGEKKAKLVRKQDKNVSIIQVDLDLQQVT